ncbi:MAG: hypothetical protein J6J18_06550 [Oscillospiraceae bacterium]|nr:hypothetical protein [Oscillospiraceae bacterium]
MQENQQNGSVQWGSVVSFRISVETENIVQTIASTQGRSASSVYRDMIDKGLAAAGYISGTEDIQQLVRNAIEEELKPHVERLATISAKGTQLSAAAFFLAAYNGRLQVPEAYREEFDAIAASARKLGIEYLKLSKDRNLDDFIRDGLNRMYRYD